MSARRSFVSLALAALLTGCGSTATTAPGKSTAPDGKPVVQSLRGDSCRWEPRRDAAGTPGVPLPIDIVCGEGNSIAGSIYAATLPVELHAAGPAKRDGIEQFAPTTAEGLSIAARMSCKPARWAAASGGDVMLAACSLNDGGWPQLVMTTASGNFLYQAEGAPAVLPVFAAAIAANSRQPVDLGDAGTSVAKLEALLETPLPSFGTGDLADYKELIRVARIYDGQANFAEAETSYRRALDIQTRVFGAAAPGAAEVLMSLALEVSNQGRYTEAAALFRRAEPLVEASPNALDRARFASYQAIDAANQGRFADSLQFARRATALRRSRLDRPSSSLDIGGSANPLSASRGELAQSLSIEAAMAMRTGDLASAEAGATEALQIISDGRDLPLWWRPNALMLVAEIGAKMGRLPAAERDYTAALTYRKRLFGDTLPTARTYLALGRLYADEELYPKSVNAYKSAFAIIEKNRAARSEIIFDQIAPFFTAASALADRDPTQRAALEEDMLRAIQMAGSSVGDQTIARMTARLASSDPAIADLARQMQEAQRRRDTARLQLVTETTKPNEQRVGAREASLMQEVASAPTNSDALLRKLQEVFPAYSKLTNPGPVDLGELRGQLKDGEALLAFAIGRESSYGVVIAKDGFEVRPLKVNQASLASAVDELRKAFVPRLGTVPDFDLGDAYALYGTLLKPFEKTLAGVNRLTVVASGPLASLPLGILVTSKPGSERDYVRASWLVRRMALSQVPSMRAFINLRVVSASRPRPANPFLGFGDPSFTGAGQQAATGGTKTSSLSALATHCRGDGPMPAELLTALAPLPETAGEVNTVAHLLGADAKSVFLGRAATEQNLRALPLDQYAILYFATHGLLPGELRCQAEPGLALSPPSPQAASKSEDGLLDATEIAGLSLNADLIVLSACNTAEGGGGADRYGGEALSGLAESFFYAGAHSLLASHWEVPSKATVQLMTGLFERVGRGGSVDVVDALRQSQLALLDQPASSHPFFWGAFVLIGDGSQTTIGRSYVAAGATPPDRRGAN
jgi:CHAT domain-containing protein